MSRFVHLLEPRMLFTLAGINLTGDASALISEAKAPRSIVLAERTSGIADRKAIIADLGRSPGKVNAKLIAQLERSGKGVTTE